MEITRSLFRKVIIAQFVLMAFYMVMYFIFGSNEAYSQIESELLRQGFLEKHLSLMSNLIIWVILILAYLVGLTLLYFFKTFGRPLFLTSGLLTLLVVSISSDTIHYAPFYAIESIDSFLGIFTLYLVYLTPLKNEFRKNKGS